MRPGQAAPEFDEAFAECLADAPASMRPGQAAPEFNTASRFVPDARRLQ